MQLCGFLNYCYGYWTTVWSLDYCVFTELLTPLTRKWSHNCTYRKMKTEVIISFSTKISQFSINKWFLRVESLQRLRPKHTTKKWAPFLIFGWHFFTVAKLLENTTKHLSGVPFLWSLFISPSLYILLRFVFLKNTRTNDVYLALSVPAPSWNTMIPESKVI